LNDEGKMGSGTSLTQTEGALAALEHLRSIRQPDMTIPPCRADELATAIGYNEGADRAIARIRSVLAFASDGAGTPLIDRLIILRSGDFGPEVGEWANWNPFIPFLEMTARRTPWTDARLDAIAVQLHAMSPASITQQWEEAERRSAEMLLSALRVAGDVVVQRWSMP